MCSVAPAGRRRSGEVPHDPGIGRGDDLGLVNCLNCGQVRGAFPLPPTRLKQGADA